MKRKIGIVIEENILKEAKKRASREGRPLSGLFQDALRAYSHSAGSREDAERAARLFCSHRSQLAFEEIKALLGA